MLVATHRYCPASSSWTLWICRTPFGKTVSLKHTQITHHLVKMIKEWIFVKLFIDTCRYLSVRSGNVLWLSSQVMVAGGLEVTAQENLATDPSITTTGTGCKINSEIAVDKKILWWAKSGGQTGDEQDLNKQEVLLDRKYSQAHTLPVDSTLSLHGRQGNTFDLVTLYRHTGNSYDVYMGPAHKSIFHLDCSYIKILHWCLWQTKYEQFLSLL